VVYNRGEKNQIIKKKNDTTFLILIRWEVIFLILNVFLHIFQFLLLLSGQNIKKKDPTTPKLSKINKIKISTI